MPGGRLTSEDRQRIAEGLAEGLGYAELGRRLGRPASTVMREVTRNGGPDGYAAERAAEATQTRARRAKKAQPEVPAVTESGYGRDPRAVRDFTEAFTELIARSGLPRMEARVLAAVFTTDAGSLTAADLVQRLRVSAASVSHAVGFLEQQGLIRRERLPGERRERYVTDDEVWLRSILGAAEMNETLAGMARQGADVLGEETPAGARFASSAELFLLIGGSMRELLEQCRQHLAAREDERRA
ncbi:helix-turn-helix domain-containing protein [Kitasatospora putterlickiae]|uniref:Helix-turn-helix domain-containing protein n=1 Tax=Kitasatospora putterlickiae TaxID=221725 RepID=A0ABP4IYN5_9ACTN